METVPHYLAIDWGERKIGLSLADAETRLPYPFETWTNSPDILGKLKALITERQVTQVIVGVPSYHGEGEHPAEVFAARLEAESGLPVERVDEMFTSKLARTHLMAGDMKNVGRQDDVEAARILLEDWLATHPASGE